MGDGTGHMIVNELANRIKARLKDQEWKAREEAADFPVGSKEQGTAWRRANILEAFADPIYWLLRRHPDMTKEELLNALQGALPALVGGRGVVRPDRTLVQKAVESYDLAGVPHKEAERRLAQRLRVDERTVRKYRGLK